MAKNKEQLTLALEGKRRCRECGEIKLIENFSIHTSRATLAGGTKAEYRVFCSYCRPCESARSSRFKLRRHGSFAAAARYAKFGVSAEDFNDMLESQNNKCAVCGDGLLVGKTTNLDHSHCTGLVRGVVCQRCNTFIGFIEKTPDLYDKAMRYLAGGAIV